MEIIHIAGKAQKLFYQSTEDIYSEILSDIRKREFLPEVFKIYTYPEEAFIKREAIFFTEEETDQLLTKLQRFLVQNNLNAVLCFGILREEFIDRKRFMINSAVMISKESAMVFDKQVVSGNDTIWGKVKDNNKLNFIGDYINISNLNKKPYTYSHSYFDATAGYSKTSVKDSPSYIPPEMAISGMMQRSTGSRIGQVWKNYMAVETNTGTVGIWVGICKEIFTGNFIRRYESLRAGAGFDKEILIILANDLNIIGNKDKIPSIPFFFNDKCKDIGLTGCFDRSGNLEACRDVIFSMD